MKYNNKFTFLSLHCTHIQKHRQQKLVVQKPLQFNRSIKFNDMNEGIYICFWRKLPCTHSLTRALARSLNVNIDWMYIVLWFSLFMCVVLCDALSAANRINKYKVTTQELHVTLKTTTTHTVESIFRSDISDNICSWSQFFLPERMSLVPCAFHSHLIGHYFT